MSRRIIEPCEHGVLEPRRCFYFYCPGGRVLSAPTEDMIERMHLAAFRKADELRWEGEEQLMGDLIEIVDAAVAALWGDETP